MSICSYYTISLQIIKDREAQKLVAAAEMEIQAEAEALAQKAKDELDEEETRADLDNEGAETYVPPRCKCVSQFT